MARVLGGIGRTLVSAGVIVLLFVVYEVWGTNLQEASAQRSLRKEYAAAAADAPTITRPTVTSTTSTTTTSTTTTIPGTPPTSAGPSITAVPREPAEAAPVDLPVPQEGEPFGIIKIPKIGVRKTIVQGVTVQQLKRAPGHYPETPLPGQLGNAAIAGHRTTYGAPFHNVNRLEVGDTIEIETLYGKFEFEIDSKKIVSPSDTSVLQDRGDARITLTSCHPIWSANQRIIISARLIGPPIGKLNGQDRFEKEARAEAKERGDTGETIDGLSGGPTASKTPAILWGLLAALVWLAAWAVHRLIKRQGAARLLTWTPYAVGLPIFLVVLYVFFENFSLLLPANF